MPYTARTSHSCSSINTTLLLYSDITIHQFGVAFSVLVLIIRLYLVTSWGTPGQSESHLLVTESLLDLLAVEFFLAVLVRRGTYLDKEYIKIPSEMEVAPHYNC